MADIFISLSGEDKAWGDWIAWQLKQAGYNPIYQHWHFQPGENFLLHMEEAGRRAERVLVVLSRHYFGSDYTLRELTQALYRDPAGRKGTIIPVKVGPCDLDGSLLAPLTYIDLTGIADEETARCTLIDALRKKGPPLIAPPFPPDSKQPIGSRPYFPGTGRREPGEAQSPPLARLYNVPSLPPNYLPRPDELALLKRAISDTAAQAVGIVGAVHYGLLGMGGIGKSVLAVALAHDNGVRATFPDGVIWLTFGRHADLVSKQAELMRALGQSMLTSNNWHEGRAQLGEVTANSACLIILDDIWDRRHAEAFGRLGRRCRLLVTTRDRRILEKIGAQVHRLDELSPEAALDLLARCIGRSAEALPPAARDVVRECGRLPFALAVIGGLTRAERFTWQGALDRLRHADLKRLRAILPEYEHESVLAALEISVEELPPAERDAFRDCVVFPEDVTVPEGALLTLWSERFPDPEDAADAAQLLVDRSLLRRDEGRRYRLHDLYHDYLRATAGDLPALHRRFVEAYRARCPDGWWSGPDDGYFFRRLPWHLAQAGGPDQLREVLFDYPWLRAKLAATSAAELTADFELLPDDQQACWFAGALRLSAHVLAVDPRQLGSQLWGRLASDDGSDIARVLADAWLYADRPSLLPRRATLIPPGTPLVRTFAGHAGPVEAVVALPDARRAFSGSWDGTLRLWDLQSGAELRRVESDAGGVKALAVLADGQRILSGARGGTLQVWDLESGAELRRFEGHESWVNAVAVLPDERRALSGSDDDTLRLWDLERGVELHRLEGHEDWINTVAVLPDGQRALSGSDDGTLRLWDLEAGILLAVFTGDAAITCLAATPDGRSVVAGDAAGTMHLLDILL